MNSHPNAMNVEQLARDIASLPEAHRHLDSAIPMTAPIDQRVELVVHELRKLREENKRVVTVECSQLTHGQLNRIPEMRPYAQLHERVGLLVDELLQLRAQASQVVGGLNLEQGHRILDRAHPHQMLSFARRLDNTVDELLQLRRDNTQLLKENALLEDSRLWTINPTRCGSSKTFRVMRGEEIATPMPLSQEMAEALCKELNSRGPTPNQLTGT